MNWRLLYFFRIFVFAVFSAAAAHFLGDDFWEFLVSMVAFTALADAMENKQ